MKLSVFQELVREEWESKLQFHEPARIEGSSSLAMPHFGDTTPLVFTDASISEDAFALDTAVEADVHVSLAAPEGALV